MAALAIGVCEMMGEMFFTFADGFEPYKICLSIAKGEAQDATKLLFGPMMHGLTVTEEFTNAPCLANYNNVVYLFYPNGSSLLYGTYSGTGWSTSPITIPNANPAAGASAVVFNGLLYVFYQGGASSGTCSSPGLWYNVFNGASWSDPVQVPSVLMANSSSTCSPTTTINVPIANIPIPAQYASAPSAIVYNTQLYVFYQGASGGQLWYTAFNGSSWFENNQVSGTVMSCSPSAVAYNNGNDIYVFYQGGGKNGQLWYAYSSDGSGFTNTQVTACSAGVQSSPQAGIYNGNIVVVHQGNGDDGQVYYLYYNGTAWSADNELLPVSLSNSPAPVVYNGELYNFMQDKNTAGQLWYTGSDGNNWSLMNQVNGASMSYAPACVVFNNQLYAFYNGPSQNGKLFYSLCTTNWDWSTSTINPIELSDSPSAIYFNNYLVCLFQNNGILFCTVYDATKNAWSQPFPLPATVIGTPSAVAYTPPGATSAQLYIFYQAAADNGVVGGLWYITGDPTTGTYTAATQVTGVTMLGSPSAVVFTPSGAASPQLYVFYQSAGACDYSVFNGASWTSGSTGVEMAESPSAVVFTPPGATTSSLYVFYQGNSGGWLYSTVFNGSSWANNTTEHGGITGSPSAAIFNNSIYVFHQGQSNTGDLWYNVFNGTAWAGDTEVSGGAVMSNSPSGVAVGTQLYVFYEGLNENEQLWYNVMSASGTWAGQTQVVPWSSDSSPCLVCYNNVQYCFFETNGQLCYCINSGGTDFWTTQMLVPGVTLSGTPSAAYYGGLVYIFYQNAAGGQLWYVTYNNSTSSWSAPIQLLGVNITQSPSAVVFENELYVFYSSGTETASTIYYSVFNGTGWAAPVAPAIGGMSYSLSAVVFTPPGSTSAQIYVFYQGGGASGGLFYNVFNGSSWTKNAQVPNVSMTGSPSATALIDRLCVAHQGSGSDGQLWYNVFNGSSWAGDTQVPGVTLTGSPAASALNNYSWWIVYGTSSGQLGCAVCTGENSWQAQTQLVPPNYTASDAIFSFSPSVVAFNPGGELLLYVFCNSADGGGQPYYCNSTDGSNWSDFVEVPGTGMSASPSPVAFNGKIYLFHQGAKQNGQLWCNVMSDSWGGDTHLVISDEGDILSMFGNLGPSAVVFQGQIYCFFNQGVAASNGYLNYVVVTESDILAGGSFTPPLYFVNTASPANVDQSPAAIVYNNVLYVFYQNEGGSVNTGSTQLFYVSTSDGVTWNGPTQAGHGQPAAGGGILAVLANQAQIIVTPFVTNYLVPDNLFQTAILKDLKPGHEWVTPKFGLDWDAAAG